jgi:acyl-CoA reductase-like NAD-dependent aldehyde dehydrogenase
MTTRLDRSQTRAAISDELLRQRTVWASFIAGAFVDIEDAVQIPVLEAATGRPLAQVATANAITVDPVSEGAWRLAAGGRRAGPRARR